MLQLTNVTKVFNQGRHSEFRAIGGISLEIGRNQVTVFKGPSGSGKTTLVAMLACLSRPTSGRITLEGEAISSLPERFLTAVRRRTFGFIFQRFNLIRGLSVLENVMLPAYPDGPAHTELVARAWALLERFDLADKAAAKAEWLSGGEAQRTAIARALINDPENLVADEPTANLDTALSRDFMSIVAQLKAQGKGVILTSHDPIVYQAPIVDRVYAMRDGVLAE